MKVMREDNLRRARSESFLKIRIFNKLTTKDMIRLDKPILGEPRE